MSLFDLIAGALIAVCALAGYQRGAVREVVGLFAFSLAVIAALRLLPLTGPMAADLFHARWLSLATALVMGFVATFILIHLFSGWLTRRLSRQAVLGGANQALGLFAGALRALFLLGLAALLLDAVTPEAERPAWITSAFFYPLASASGRLISATAPRSLMAFGRPSALLNGEDSPDTTQTNQSGAAPAPAKPPAHPKRHRGKGYDQSSRDRLDALVERTR